MQRSVGGSKERKVAGHVIKGELGDDLDRGAGGNHRSCGHTKVA